MVKMNHSTHTLPHSASSSEVGGKAKNVCELSVTNCFFVNKSGHFLFRKRKEEKKYISCVCVCVCARALVFCNRSGYFPSSQKKKKVRVWGTGGGGGGGRGVSS